MNWMYPQFLYALAALALPVIIHLLQFRRTKVHYFPNIKWLQDIQVQTQSQSRLKHLLLLLCRMLVFTFIVLAFAQPYWPADSDFGSGKGISIYLDNSFSMDAPTEEGRALDVAKSRAAELVQAFGGQKQFQIIDNGNDLMGRKWLSMEEALDRIAGLGLQQGNKSMTQVLEQVKALAPSTAQAELFILSDLPVGFLQDVDSLAIRSHFMPIQHAEIANISLDSAYFVQEVEGEVLHFRLSNHGKSTIEQIPVQLLHQDQVLALKNVDLVPGTDQWFRMNFKALDLPSSPLVLEVNEDPIAFDNKLYLVHKGQNALKVLHLYQQKPNPYLEALYGSTAFSYQQQSIFDFDFRRLEQMQVLLLDELEGISDNLAQKISNFVELGGRLIIIPSEEVIANQTAFKALKLPLGEWTESKDLRIKNWEKNHPIFQGVFESGNERYLLPEVNGYYTFRTWPEQLLRLENEAPFLVGSQRGSGFIYAFACPLRKPFTQFQRHELIVPLAYNLAFRSSDSKAAYAVLGSSKGMPIPAELCQDEKLEWEKDGQAWMSSCQAGRVFIPKVWKVAGFYASTSPDLPRHYLAINFPRSESALSQYPSMQWENWVNNHAMADLDLNVSGSNLATQLKAYTQDAEYWKLCIILALLFLLIESAMMRWLN